jgi:hypothetical protein
VALFGISSMRNNRAMVSVEASLLIQSQIGAHRYLGHQLEVYLNKGMGPLSEDRRLDLIVDGFRSHSTETICGLAG